MSRTLNTAIQITYAILLVVGALLYTLDVAYTEYVFAAGAVIAIVHTFIYAIQNRPSSIKQQAENGNRKSSADDRRTARLHGLHFIATLFLGVAAWLMIVHSSSWMPFMLIYALVVFFLSFRTK